MDLRDEAPGDRTSPVPQATHLLPGYRRGPGLRTGYEEMAMGMQGMGKGSGATGGIEKSPARARGDRKRRERAGRAFGGEVITRKIGESADAVPPLPETRTWRGHTRKA